MPNPAFLKLEITLNALKCINFKDARAKRWITNKQQQNPIPYHTYSVQCTLYSTLQYNCTTHLSLHFSEQNLTGQHRWHLKFFSPVIKIKIFTHFHSKKVALCLLSSIGKDNFDIKDLILLDIGSGLHIFDRIRNTGYLFILPLIKTVGK